MAASNFFASPAGSSISDQKSYSSSVSTPFHGAGVAFPKDTISLNISFFEYTLAASLFSSTEVSVSSLLILRIWGGRLAPAPTLNITCRASHHAYSEELIVSSLQ